MAPPRHSRRRRTAARLAVPALLAGLGLGLGGLGLTPAAPARAAEWAWLAYTVWVGPLPALDVSTTIDIQDGTAGRLTSASPRYRIAATVAPQPWIAWALPWQAHSETSGHLPPDGLPGPEAYRSTATWGSRTRKTDLTYGTGSGVLVTLDPPGDNDNREPVPPEMIAGSLDPISAVLMLLTTVGHSRTCPTLVPVFDGHRRFDMRSETRPEPKMPEDSGSAYAGPATVCRLHFQSLAGGWKKGEKSRFWQTDRPGAERPPIDLWLAPLREGALPVPVFVSADSILGPVTVTLTSRVLAPATEPGPAQGAGGDRRN